MASFMFVRSARIEDASAMALVHVRAWQETYHGLMSSEVLDDPRFVSRRERFWRAAPSDGQPARNRFAVAESNGKIVGIAWSGSPVDDDSSWDVQLYVLYLLAAHHGSGAGLELLEAVVPATEAASLWVADPNPRAQAFYRKQGFRADGLFQVKDDVRESG